nr:protein BRASSINAZOLE-RESISTANT 1-like [Ipomoea batatas]
MFDKGKSIDFGFENVAMKAWEGERAHEVGLDDLELKLGSGSTRKFIAAMRSTACNRYPKMFNDCFAVPVFSSGSPRATPFSSIGFDFTTLLLLHSLYLKHISVFLLVSGVRTGTSLVEQLLSVLYNGAKLCFRQQSVSVSYQLLLIEICYIGWIKAAKQPPATSWKPLTDMMCFIQSQRLSGTGAIGDIDIATAPSGTTFAGLFAFPLALPFEFNFFNVEPPDLSTAPVLRTTTGPGFGLSAPNFLPLSAFFTPSFFFFCSSTSRTRFPAGPSISLLSTAVFTSVVVGDIVKRKTIQARRTNAERIVTDWEIEESLGLKSEMELKRSERRVQCREEEDDGKTDGGFWSYNVNCLDTGYRK